MRHLPVFAWIGGEDDCGCQIGVVVLPKCNPPDDTFRDCLNPWGFNTVGKTGKLQVVVFFARLFKRGDARKNAAIYFRQNDVHGEVCGGKPAFFFIPGFAP